MEFLKKFWDTFTLVIVPVIVSSIILVGPFAALWACAYIFVWMIDGIWGVFTISTDECIELCPEGRRNYSSFFCECVETPDEFVDGFQETR